ncbi:platelet glycoprotein Ib alpha chain [Monodelphis domestica]|uniref:platelet glycoprotein Ib alpha chain n=1 Tax=Monodelphis domestica TaxID=13616 RepID=UPI0004432FE9|nr:platelet glycoprotein Ib alpha chain [Monodelphis domestica]
MILRSSWEMDPRLFLVLFPLLLGISHSQPPCEIHKVASKLETNCESLGLKAVPSKLSPDTAILHLQNNGLKSFSTSSFSLLTQLTELYLARNNISVLVADGKLPLLSVLDLSDNALKVLPQLGHSLPSLTFLDLSRNALESLSPGALDGLSSLENLYLRDNKLRSLPQNFLQATRKLEKLDLANNYLEHLSADLLANLSNLNTLFLQNNLLSVLPVGFFFHSPRLAYVFLHSNPWNCNCDLRYLHRWLRENPGSVYLWKEGVDVKAMTPNVNTVECKVPSKTAVYYFSMNCPITGDNDYDSYDSYDGYDELTVTEVPESKTTTIPITTNQEHSIFLSSSKITTMEPTTFSITPETTPTTQGSTTFLKSSQITVFPSKPKFTRFLISETTFQIAPETTTSPTTQGSTTFLNNPETTMFSTMPELTRFPISSEANIFQITAEASQFSENLKTTRFSTSPEPTIFPTPSETTPKLVTFPSTHSTLHTSSIPVTSTSLSSTLTLMKSNILPPNEFVALGSLGYPRDSSPPTSISCCLLSLVFYIFGIAWVLVSSIVLILFLALAQPPPHLLRNYPFIEDNPNPQTTVHLELLKGKEVIVHRSWLLFLEGLVPSFRTRLFLWVRSDGRVRPLTLKRKPSALSLGRGEDLLGKVSIRYSGHSL